MLDQKPEKKHRRNKHRKVKEFPIVPQKLYFTISEASDLCFLEPHVLRFWQQEFPQLKPEKRSGGQRRYRAEDISLIRKIRELLYEKGFTIEGARAFLEEGKKTKVDLTQGKRAHQLLDYFLNKLENLATELDD